MLTYRQRERYKEKDDKKRQKGMDEGEMITER